MADTANVTSIDAVAKFASAVRIFEEQSSNALLSIEEQTRRALQWIEHDAAQHWSIQVRKGFEDVARTRVALMQARNKGTKDYHPSCIDEIKAYKAAQVRLYHAEEQVEKVRRWAQRMHKEVSEYRGRIQTLKHCLEVDVPKTLAVLDRTFAALETYVDRQRQPTDTSSNEAGASAEDSTTGESR